MDQAHEHKMVIPGGGRFRLGQLLLALAGGLAAGVAMAWLAAQVQQLRAPWLIFPLATGLVLGVTLVGWVRLIQAGHRPTVVVVSLLAAATLIVGQHYFSFRAILQTTRQKSPAMEKARLLFAGSSWEESPLPPTRFGPFLRWQAARGRRIGRFVARGGLAWASWTLDGLLLAAAALAVVGPSIPPSLLQPLPELVPAHATRPPGPKARGGSGASNRTIAPGARVGGRLPNADLQRRLWPEQDRSPLAGQPCRERPLLARRERAGKVWEVLDQTQGFASE